MRSAIFFIFFFIVLESKSQSIINSSRWQPFVSFTNAQPDFSRNIYTLNSQLDIRHIKYDLWSSHQVEVGAYYKLKHATRLKLSFGYSNTEQYGQFINYLSDQDLIDYGAPTFQLVRFTYEHKRLLLQAGLRQYVFRGLFAETSVSGALNISSPYKSDFLTYLSARDVYEPLFNGAKNLSTLIMFGSLKIGYEYKGFYVSSFHEMNLSPINHSFAFRGNDYNIRYRHWINRGIRVGYIFTIKNTQLKN